MSKTSLLPTCALVDTRLNAADLRVLSAICSHDRRCTGAPVSIIRKDIAAATNLTETWVSRVTQRLVMYGWITKKPGGGRGVGVQFSINWALELCKKTVSPGRTVYRPETVSPGLTEKEGETVSAGLTVSQENSEPRAHGFKKTVSPGLTVSPENSEPRAHGLPPYSTVSVSVSTSRQSHEDGNYSRAVLCSVGDVQRILNDAGVPLAFTTNPADQRIMQGWTERYSLEQIQRAVDIAVQNRKSKNSRVPVSTRYVDGILSRGGGSDEASRQHGESGNEQRERQNWLDRGDAAGDEFLEKHAQSQQR